MTSNGTISDRQGTCRAEVFYDGSCPLCRREIAVYRNRLGDEAVDWVDVSKAGGRVIAPDLDRDTALRRFHVRDTSGTLLSGAAAFVELWRQTPGFRWLARLARLPGMTPLLEIAYRGFLVLRPAVQRLFARWA